MVNPRIPHGKVMVSCAPVISIIAWMWSIHYASLSAMLHGKTNQELYKKHLCNLGSHYEKKDNFHYAYKGSHHMQPPNRHILMSTKTNGTQRRTVVSPWRMHCAYCGMPKSTSRAEVMPNSEKTMLVVCAVIKLCLSECSQSVRRKFH